jgi:hypothetical protein
MWYLVKLVGGITSSKQHINCLSPHRQVNDVS